MWYITALVSAEGNVDILEHLSASQVHVESVPVEHQIVQEHVQHAAVRAPEVRTAPTREIQRVDPDKLPGSKLDLSFQVWCIVWYYLCSINLFNLLSIYLASLSSSIYYKLVIIAGIGQSNLLIHSKAPSYNR